MMEHILTRRALAAALPLAALADAPALAVLRPLSQHPDDQLLKLVERLHAAEARRQELDQVVAEAFDRIESADVPDALIWRESDFPGICMDHRDRCAQYRIGGEWRYVFENRNALASWWTDPNPRNPHAFSERDRPRATEILDTIAQWESANRRAEDAAGYTEACEAAEREAERCSELRRRIIFTKALTRDGMMAKVRALITLFPEDPSWVEQRLHEAVARGDSADISRWIGMSLALDAMSLPDDASPATTWHGSAAA